MWKRVSLHGQWTLFEIVMGFITKYSNFVILGCLWTVMFMWQGWLFCLTWWDSGWWSWLLDSSPFHKEALSSHHYIWLELQGNSTSRTFYWRGERQTTEFSQGIIMNRGPIKYLKRNKESGQSGQNSIKITDSSPGCYCHHMFSTRPGYVISSLSYILCNNVSHKEKT